MRQYVLSGYLNGLLRNVDPKTCLPKRVPPEDTGQTLDYLLEYYSDKVEVAASDVAVTEALIWLWYRYDNHVSNAVYISLEQHLAAPPPTPEHPAEQPHPNEVD